MAAIIIGITVMAIVMTAAMPAWKHAAQREKEAELVFRGEQYVHAIGLFQRKYANAYPPNLELLVEQKFLRRKYKDPITGEDFLPLTQASQQGGVQPGGGAQRGGQTTTQGGLQGQQQNAGRGRQAGPAGSATPGGAPAGGIVGVTSKSTDASIRLYKGRSHYNEWAFVYTAPVQAPGAGVPGQRGGQPGQQGQPQIPGPGGGLPGRGGRGPFPGGPNGPARGNFPTGQPTFPQNPGTRGQPPIFPGTNGPGRGR